MNENEFQSLIRWLGSSRDEGARKYEQVRKKLLRIFTLRACGDPENLVDITIDRVAHAVGQPGFAYRGDPLLYFYGFARNVYREFARNQGKTVALSFDVQSPSADGSEELMSECLEKCLRLLSPKNRELIKAYYEYEIGHKAEYREGLARERGIGINALRIHAHRLRLSLKDCIRRCAAN